MKLKIKPPKSMRHVVSFLTECPPFVQNDRAVLIHRPRSVAMFNLHGYMHAAIQFYCGTTALGPDGITFIDSPPEDKLLCKRCEDIAVSVAHLPPADTICGKHIHLGKVVARRACHTDKGEAQP